MAKGRAKFPLVRGGGKISIFFIIRDRAFKIKYQYFHINQRNSIFFLPGSSQGGGGNISISLLLEIGPSNIDINIFILIKKN